MRNTVICRGTAGNYRLQLLSASGRLYAAPDGRMARLFPETQCTPELSAKLQAMVEKHVDPMLGQTVTLAWPDELLCDRGRIIGYLMPRNGSGIPLTRIFAGGDVGSYFGTFSFSTRVVIAVNLAMAVSALHAAGVILCRFDPSEIFIDKNGKVLLTGLEHCTFTRNGAVYAEPYIENACSAPEGTYSEAADRFSLAVLLFRLLYGVHPFFIGNSISENIKYGDCAFLRDPQNPRLSAYIPFTTLPAAVTELFRRCFDYTASTVNAAARPSAKEFCAALIALHRSGYTDCILNPEHVYPRRLTVCPWCRLEKRKVQYRHFGA